MFFERSDHTGKQGKIKNLRCNNRSGSIYQKKKFWGDIEILAGW